MFHRTRHARLAVHRLAHRDDVGDARLGLLQQVVEYRFDIFPARFADRLGARVANAVHVGGIGEHAGRRQQDQLVGGARVRQCKARRHPCAERAAHDGAALDAHRIKKVLGVPHIVGDLVVAIRFVGKTAASHVDGKAREMRRVRGEVGGKPLPAAGRAVQHQQRRLVGRTGLRVTGVDAPRHNPVLTKRQLHHVRPDRAVFGCVGCGRCR